VDDSTMCQVYNSNPETETSIFVVKDTYGIVPVYEDEVITPFYFSTSAGITCTNDDIWGGTAYGYLTSHVESLKKQQIDLSEESAFRSFLEDSNGYDTLEKDLPFYRWSIRFTNQEISDAINSNLAERIEKSDGGIQVQKSNGKFSKQNIETIGEVESIEITKRSASGVILEMEIYGSENVILVSGQTNIRNLISPENVEIVRNDGSIVTGWTSLPSPYYYVDQVQGGFEIVGGGFGHGVGMSQNGAELLAEQGYSYKFILAHYFNDIELKNIYDTEDESAEED
jgi:stage II sporulation protein D